MKPLLVVDGDSLAHRAYHALPKSIRTHEGPAGRRARRLHEHARPPVGGGGAARGASSGWDTLSVPTYRHEALAGYQSGRHFDEELLEQLDLLPEAVEALGFAAGKAPGYEADDFLGAAVAAEEKRRGARRSSSPPTATRSSSRASGRRSSRRRAA